MPTQMEGEGADGKMSRPSSSGDSGPEGTKAPSVPSSGSLLGQGIQRHRRKVKKCEIAKMPAGTGGNSCTLSEIPSKEEEIHILAQGVRSHNLAQEVRKMHVKVQEHFRPGGGPCQHQENLLTGRSPPSGVFYFEQSLENGGDNIPLSEVHRFSISEESKQCSDYAEW